MIQEIETRLIHPHYNNPRKDVGDLRELEDSILSKGILQNLTVVPWFPEFEGFGDPSKEGHYIAVIGHRRLQAAVRAGLKTVPCAISNMSYKDQIATMLLENMQRSDLTLIEQAQGIQMMMDLGETVKDISHKTGFSETTIRRRVKLNELDQDKLQKSMSSGATLMDYIELEKIEDINLRNKVLEKIGTSNFQWEINNALAKIKKDKEYKLIADELNKFAVKAEDSTGLKYITTFYSNNEFKKFNTPEDIGITKYFYIEQSYGIVLYTEKIEEATPKKSEWEIKREKRDALSAISRVYSEKTYKLRLDFVKGISNSSAKKGLHAIIYAMLYSVLEMSSSVDYDDFESFGLNLPDEDDDNFSAATEYINYQPERSLLIAAYCALDGPRESYMNWQGDYYKNDSLNKLYDMLTALGYQMSDEEMALQDGTHEIFTEAFKESIVEST